MSKRSKKKESIEIFDMKCEDNKALFQVKISGEKKTLTEEKNLEKDYKDELDEFKSTADFEVEEIVDRKGRGVIKKKKKILKKKKKKKKIY